MGGILDRILQVTLLVLGIQIRTLPEDRAQGCGNMALLLLRQERNPNVDGDQALAHADLGHLWQRALLPSRL
jgi:hypothetical protein